MTVNAAWNIWNFRRPVVESLLRDGHAVTVLAPADDSVDKLTALGCRFLPLQMDVKGLNPGRGLVLMARFLRLFRQQRPDVILRFLALPQSACAAMGQAARAHMERDYDETHVITAYRKAIGELTAGGAR